MRHRLLSGVLFSISLGLVAESAAAEDFVRSIDRAAIAQNGDVVGSTTNLVVTLDRSLHPETPGLDLQPGDRLAFALPEAFDTTNIATYPVADFTSSPECKPGNLRCTTLVLLQGWPQSAIIPLVPPGSPDAKHLYTIDYDADNRVISAQILPDFAEVPAWGPGIKQVHLTLHGFTNPKLPGRYPIGVTLTGADGTVKAEGFGFATIRGSAGATIFPSSVFSESDDNGMPPPNPNLFWQKAKVSSQLPMHWDFLMWDAEGRPYETVSLHSSDTAHAEIRSGETPIGYVVVSAPPAASGHEVGLVRHRQIGATPIIGKSFGEPKPATHMTSSFMTGDVPGRYVITFSMIDGNSSVMIVDVTE